LMMVLRANSLLIGQSGVSVALVTRLLDLVNRGVTPVVPSYGSVGASGDLAPLAHLALVLLGEGQALYEGRRMPAADALNRAGLRPLRLQAKDGIALINGTQMMTAVGVLTLIEASTLLTAADVTGACTLEALRGSHHPFEERLHALRPHPGQLTSAANLRAILADSDVERSHATCGRVQDAYSLRCMPQVHGASRDGIDFARRVLTVEIDAVTDNPIVFPEDGALLSGGNFHGQYPSMALDLLAIAAAGLATISERRIERMMNPALSGLPPFLTRDPGAHSGLMMAQVTAAALVSENKVLCHPASVDTIPTEAGQEDHVSMGPIAARKARSVVTHVRRVIAIELLSACQALDLAPAIRPGRGVVAARATVRRSVPFMEADRVLAHDIAAVEALLLDDTLLGAVRACCGDLL